jgi:hypothetical protein
VYWELWITDISHFVKLNCCYLSIRMFNLIVHDGIW